MALAAAVDIEGLKQRLRQLQSAPRTSLSTLRTGVEAFDGLLPSSGLPLSSVVEFCGEAASGKSTLSLRAVAAAQREKRLCAWLDGPSEFYPPAAQALGVDLPRLLVVRPAASQLLWAAQQLCRSGAFACVVVDLTRTSVRLSLTEGKKLSDAAFRGGTLLLLLTAASASQEPWLRLGTSVSGLDGVCVEIQRSRQGALGRRALIPWQALSSSLVPAYRVFQKPAQEIPVPEPSASFYRLKQSDIRNGGGLYATRPGRDCAFPALGARP